jgi:hypothetical protein
MTAFTIDRRMWGQRQCGSTFAFEKRKVIEGSSRNQFGSPYDGGGLPINPGPADAGFMYLALTAIFLEKPKT